VDIVFCLDLSASTNGLIDRLRDHLWDITYLFSKCSPSVEYRIALVGFSRPSFKRETGYVKVLKDLSTDLDILSKTMYDLKTSIEKGDQYVSHALQTCLSSISWSDDTTAAKMVFLIGNGNPDQGGGDAGKMAAELAAKHIKVYTIYCLTNSGVAEQRRWEQIAEAGGGKSYQISLSLKHYTDMGSFKTNSLFELHRKLNETYLYYGPIGKQRKLIITEQDKNVYLANAEGFVYRSIFKASSLYQGHNSSWDLVDYYSTRGSISQLQLDPKLMCEELKNLNDVERNKAIVQKKVERIQLLYQIKEMHAGFEKEQAQNGKEKKMQTLDVITTTVLQEILHEKGYVCNMISIIENK
jgi:hypothetical protein